MPNNNATRAVQKRTRIRMFILGALSLAVVAAAVFAATALPGPGNAQDKADGLLNIREVKSASGISAWLVEDHNLPVISMAFAFHGAGAALDPVDKQGLSTLASNTFDEGAGDYDSQAFQKALSDHSIGLSFGASRDDFTGSLKTLKRHEDLAFKLLNLALTQPRFDADAVDRMRASNIARVRNAVGDPNWVAARILNDTAYNGHPYAMNSGGTLTTLTAITPDDLKNFAKTRLSRDSLVITVAGDITPAELKKRLDEVFGALPAKNNLPPVAALTIQGAGQHVHFNMDIPQTMIEIIQPGIGRDDPDYYAAAIMDFILGGSGFGSRLMEEVREKRGLTYGIYSSFTMMDHVKGYGAATSTRNETAAEVLGLIKAEWKKIGEAPPAAEEVAAAQNYLIGSLPLSLSSTDSIAGILLGLRLEDLPINYLDSRAAKINAVTAEDVQRVAKRLLTPDALTVITVGKPVNMTPTKTLDSLPHVD
jgi:zinc protease